MDYILFEEILKKTIYVQEKSEYLEIYNYKSGAPFIERAKLSDDDFNNFVRKQGVFSPRERSTTGSLPVSGIRLVMQVNCKHQNTFTGNHISLTKPHYREMTSHFCLPWRSLEGTCTVGPFFWSGCSGRGSNRVYQIMARKSDVLKKAKTRGWELMLSYNFETRITSGYYKCTESAKPNEILHALMKPMMSTSLAHPFVLPMTIVSVNELSVENEDRQRQARELLRHLENAIVGREDADTKQEHVHEGVLIIEQINRDLYECVCKVLWKRPQAYLSMLTEMDAGLESWWRNVCEDGRRREKEYQRSRDKDAPNLGRPEMSVEHNDLIADLNEDMRSRVAFYSIKLKGIESYAWTSMQRLKVQREALYNIIAQRESKLNLEMAKSQKHIANSSKRDGNTMKTLSILGALFLPGTFLASVFSMTFFNFQDSSTPTVSKYFWVYFAITIPVTVVVVVGWFVYEAWQQRQHKLQEEDVNKEMESLETSVLSNMRHKSMAHRNTTLQSRPTWSQNPAAGDEGSNKFGFDDSHECEKEHRGIFGHSRGHQHSHSLTHSLSVHFGGHNRNTSQGTNNNGRVTHSRSHGHLGAVSQLAAQSMTNLTPHAINGGVNAGRSPSRSPRLLALGGLTAGIPSFVMGGNLDAPAFAEDISPSDQLSAEKMGESNDKLVGDEIEAGLTTVAATDSTSGGSREGPTESAVGDGDGTARQRWHIPEKQSDRSLV